MATQMDMNEFAYTHQLYELVDKTGGIYTCMIQHIAKDSD